MYINIKILIGIPDDTLILIDEVSLSDSSWLDWLVLHCDDNKTWSFGSLSPKLFNIVNL